MDHFALQVAAWQPFYATVATAAATLVGLLFVSLSINLEKLRKQQNTRLLRRARHAFTSFIFILAIALMFLIPDQSPSGLGTPLICMGAVGIIRLSSALIRDLRSRQNLDRLTYFFSEYSFQLIAYGGMVIVSLDLLFGQVSLLNWMVGVVVSLLVSASQNAWYLLFQVEDPSI